MKVANDVTMKLDQTMRAERKRRIRIGTDQTSEPQAVLRLSIVGTLEYPKQCHSTAPQSLRRDICGGTYGRFNHTVHTGVSA